MTYAHGCRPNRTHSFDSVSGWCRHGCGVREDARVLNRAGDVILPGRELTPEQKAYYLDRAQRAMTRTSPT